VAPPRKTKPEPKLPQSKPVPKPAKPVQSKPQPNIVKIVGGFQPKPAAPARKPAPRPAARPPAPFRSNAAAADAARAARAARDAAARRAAELRQQGVEQARARAAAEERQRQARVAAERARAEVARRAKVVADAAARDQRAKDAVVAARRAAAESARLEAAAARSGTIVDRKPGAPPPLRRVRTDNPIRVVGTTVAGSTTSDLRAAAARARDEVTRVRDAHAAELKLRAAQRNAGLDPGPFGATTLLTGQRTKQPKKQPESLLLTRVERDPSRFAPSRDPKVAKTHADLDRALAPAGKERLAALLVDRNFKRAQKHQELGKTTVRDLVDLLFDPHHATFDPSNPTHVKIVQTFLHQQGEKVGVDGVYGPATHNALVNEFAKAGQRERTRQRETVSSVLYDSGILHAGQTAPSWLPYRTPEGRVPQPGDLLHVLQHGGFTAAVTWRALVNQAKKPDVQFAKWRHDQIDRLDRTLDRFNGNPVFGLSTVVPRTELDKIVRIASSPATSTPQGAAQIRSLIRSRTLGEFKTNLKVIQKAEDKAWLEEQKRRAKKDLPFWMDGLKAMDDFGKRFRTDVVTQIEWSKRDPWGFITGRGVTKQDRRDYNAQAVQWIESQHGLGKIAFDLAVDPINFFPIARAGRLALVGAAGVAELGGRGLITAAARGEIADRVGASVIEQSGKFLVHAGEQHLFVPAAKALALDAFTRTALATDKGRAVLYVAHRLTRARSVALDAAKASVMGGMRHGFVEPAKRITGKVVAPAEQAAPAAAEHATAPAPHAAAELAKPAPHEAFGNLAPIDKEVRDLLDMTHAEMQDVLPSTLTNLVDALHKSGGSIWADAARSEGNLTSDGAAIRARALAQARTTEALKLAARSADDASDAVLQKVDGAVLSAEGRVIGLPTTAEARQATEDAKAAAVAEYDRVKNSIGTYRRGSGDHELLAKVNERVQHFADKLDHVVLPALQHYLENLAAQSGRYLFDANGKWLYAEGAGQDAIRRAARESFENTIELDNPLYGKPMTFLDAKEHIDEEINRRVGRLNDYFSREVERGNPLHLTQAWRDEETVKIEDEVRGAWKAIESPDGHTMYVDTRPTFQESALYAGHLRDALRASPTTAQRAASTPGRARSPDSHSRTGWAKASTRRSASSSGTSPATTPPRSSGSPRPTPPQPKASAASPRTPPTSAPPGATSRPRRSNGRSRSPTHTRRSTPPSSSAKAPCGARWRTRRPARTSGSTSA
jgi:hypothetical protein